MVRECSMLNDMFTYMSALIDLVEPTGSTDAEVVAAH